MRKQNELFKKTILTLIENIRKHKALIIVMSAIVVIATTYSLIIPASTLEKEKALEMGGIDLEAVSEEQAENEEAEEPEEAEQESEKETEESKEEVKDEVKENSIEKTAADDTEIKEEASKNKEEKDVEENEEKAEEENGNGNILTFDGNGYSVTVTYEDEANIPEGAKLSVTPVTKKTSGYSTYTDKVEKMLVLEEEKDVTLKLFDIRITGKDGKKIEPDDSVNVEITLEGQKLTKKDDMSIVHFISKNDVEVINTVDVEKDKVSFETESFSVYAIVDAPIIKSGQVMTLDEIAEDGSNGFLMSIKCKKGVCYFKNTITNKNCIARTDAGDTESAAVWCFEPVENGNENEYYLYTLIDGEKKYIQVRSDTYVALSATDKTSFTAKYFTDGVEGAFYIELTDISGFALNYSNGNDGFKTYEAHNDDCKVVLTYVPQENPFDLDGKTYGICYHNADVKATGLLSGSKTVGGAKVLTGERLQIKPDILDNEGILLVSEESDIQEFTFERIEGTTYRMKTTVDGAVKYLSISGANVTLSDTPDDTTAINISVGTGANAGKYRFNVGNYSLNNKDGNANNGFNGVTGTGATTWMNLCEKSKDIQNDDFITYTAHKVSVSDTEKVYTGQKVVMYTRIWNEKTLAYDFYAVDYDGSLVKVFESGDTIQWVGTKVNTMLWDFTEYTDASGDATNYYELQNTYSDKYIAPQINGGQILSDDTIGVNLNGRRYEKGYTTIIAWDDDHYDYSGLKVEDGKIVSCPYDESDDFYFAIIDDEEQEEEKLSTVDTVDGNKYGISMKMVDFNNPLEAERDSVQHPFMGRTNGFTTGLLSTDIGQDGYPVTTSKTGHEASLGDLFNNGGDRLVPVNHLFLESIYNESGYFEYDSTQNFAHLNNDGTFTVYDQLAAIGTSSGPTRVHGQFMPYNELKEDVYAPYTNTTRVDQSELPDTDPRKGEKLYWITQDEADYFFGMQMEAGFTQTASGLDAWGHDIIFEFSGDDDFWLYVDDELVLDLGGVRPALSGSVNFRTGEVINAGTKTTLYEVFKKNYQARGLSQDEIDQKLSEKFEKNDKGQYVFKDYTNHTMKMFYMERGAGASNLHMRFNLAAVKPGTVMLSKKLSGVEASDDVHAEFPYQIFVKTEDSDMYRIFTEQDKVKYEGRSTNVKYREHFTPAGSQKSYDSVFLLEPGETAEITMPENIVDYYIVECGVNENIFDDVKMNGKNASDDDTELVRKPVAGENRADYETTKASVNDRPSVEYDNHVKEGALRTLSFTKRLYDVDGQTRIHYEEDPTPFAFRLSIGNENQTEPELTNLKAYHVRDKNGNYCRWNAAGQKFVSLGKDDFDDLTKEEKKAATFRTSPYGAISKIPADHTVEVRQILIGSTFKVEERENEVPKGYSLKGYDREEEVPAGEADNQGTIKENSDPHVFVDNYRGWGLTANKVWSDKDFMKSHDDIYFAVYAGTKLLDGTDGTDNTIRRLTAAEDPSLYWYFDKLVEGRRFTDYIVREVKIGDPVVDDDGYVISYSSLIPVNEAGELKVNAVDAYNEESREYTYKAHYDQGEIQGVNSNIREDIVTNSRPGIEVRKTDWSGAALANAVFTFKDEDGKDVGANASFKSGKDGFVTTAYLPADGTFYLKETSAPKGFIGLSDPITITMEDGHETVEAGDADSEAVSYETIDEVKTITIKNRSYELKAVKSDEEGNALENVEFALYKQVTDATTGEPRKDIRPMAGYESLKTDENGIIPKITNELRPGTYYLSEVEPLEGYALIAGDLVFTISQSGAVTIVAGSDRSITEDKIDTMTSYTITLINREADAKVSFKKVDIENTDVPLAGAKFDLYGTKSDGSREDEPLYRDMISQSDGMLKIGTDKTEFDLGSGVYQLIETEAPAGYVMRKEPVIVTVTSSGVSYDEGTSISQSGAGAVQDAATGTYLIKVTNTKGVELPSAGGMGTHWIYIAGILLVLGCGIALVARKRLI